MKDAAADGLAEAGWVEVAGEQAKAIVSNAGHADRAILATGAILSPG
jgi:hypothetical protein